MKSYFSRHTLRGLALLAVSTAHLTGCATPFHEVFRSNEAKNQAPITDVISIDSDYTIHDSANPRIIENNRSYIKTDYTPSKINEEIVEVPAQTRYRVSAINATYVEDGKGNLIMQYKSRVPAPDLKALVEPHLKEIEIKEFPNQNTLIMTGKKEAFGDFKYLSTILNEFDLPPEQIRIKLRIVEYFNDNTYDRDLSLKFLREGLEAITLNLPSNPDTGEILSTGVNLNPFFGQEIIRDSTGAITNPDYYQGAIKFLDSHGKTNTLTEADMLVSNGKSAEFNNLASVPYPETIVAGNNILETSKYRDTGADIKITPYANEEGFITIKLEKAESGEQTGFIGTLQRPIFRTANLISEFTIRDGMTYFAGTSLQTRYKSVDRGVPGLNKVPVIKSMASSRSIENNQSQLIYFIEARVIPRESNVGIQKE